MDLSVIYSRALLGIEAPLVRVETHLSNGLPAFNIVGLPETAVRESKDRVRSAILNSHFEFPDRRITVNLAPADLPKEGGRFDLPIALGILSASGQVPGEKLQQHEFLGELALDGGLREVPGTISAAIAASQANRKLALAYSERPIAAAVPRSQIISCRDILTLCAHLNGSCPIDPSVPPEPPGTNAAPDLRDVVGQEVARRALEIAAAGRHHLLLWGPPGTGKTLLASRLPGIMPSPDDDEILTSLALRNMRRGQAISADDYQRPFRAPHHSASATALVGGGPRPQPGEISLAHGGVLFLDELPEFNRNCLDTLREPLESGQVTLSRASGSYTYPASFQLVAAMNPCPCGYLGDPERACRCGPAQVQRYRAKVSGPLLDRIDLQVRVQRLPPAVMLDNNHKGEASYSVLTRVMACRERQLARQNTANGNLDSEALSRVCPLGKAERLALEDAAQRLCLSGRALHRTLRVARTIADLASSDTIAIEHLHEALAYRGEEMNTSGLAST